MWFGASVSIRNGEIRYIGMRTGAQHARIINARCLIQLQAIGITIPCGEESQLDLICMKITAYG